jgi:AraC-like DNA-binding protein
VSKIADIAALRDWDVEDRIPDALYERTYADPDFPHAIRAMSRNMLDAAAENRALDAIAKDGGRFVATIWALYLDATGGLTLPRLKEICASSGILSPGRARAVLLFLRHLRYIEVVREQKRGEPAHYRPTPGLIDTWNLLTRKRLEAARILEPALDHILSRLDDPKVRETMVRHEGGGLFSVTSSVDMKNPFFDIFLHRHAGMQMLHTIMVSAEPDDDYVPKKPVPVTIGAIARRLSVSRTHVKRMLNAAEKAGLLSGAETGAITLSEEMRFLLRYVMTSLLMSNIIVASKVVRERPELFRTEPAVAAG